MKGEELEGTACSKAKERGAFVCFACAQLCERTGEGAQGVGRRSA